MTDLLDRHERLMFKKYDDQMGGLNEDEQLELESIKAEIQGLIEKGEKIPHSIEYYNELEKEILSHKDLESQVAKLKEELNGVKFGGTKNLYDIIDEYRSTLDEIMKLDIIDYIISNDEIDCYWVLEDETRESWHNKLKEIIAKHEDKE